MSKSEDPTPISGETVAEYRLGLIERQNREILTAVKEVKDLRTNDREDHRALMVRVDALEKWREAREQLAERVGERTWQFWLAIISAAASPVAAIVIAYLMSKGHA